MKPKKKDFKEAQEICSYLDQIDRLTPEESIVLSEDILKKQPFFLSVLLGYRFDVSLEEHNEIVKIYFLIYKFFRNRYQVKNKPITESQYEAVLLEMIKKLNTFDPQTTSHNGSNSFDFVYDNIQSKAILATLLVQFKNNPILLKMNRTNYNILLVGIISFVMCFETT